jgi:cysteinyl-tRNA synthetase
MHQPCVDGIVTPPNRNYVTQDILRRIMTDYFGYNVHFVMNITDIDDKACVLPQIVSSPSVNLPTLTFPKIIENSRQNYLFNKFSRENSDLSDQLIAQVRTAWNFYLRTRLARGLSEDEKIIEGQEDCAWEQIVERFKVEEWRLECLNRDVKFDMHFKAAVCILLVSTGQLSILFYLSGSDPFCSRSCINF